MFSLWQKLFGPKIKKEKHYIDVGRLYQFSYPSFCESTFVVVDETTGQVIRTGNPVWTVEGEKAFWIGLPFLSSENPDRDVRVVLTHQADGSKISVTVALNVRFTTREFNFQELYEKIAKAGFEHIDDWLRGLYLKAALKNGAVVKAFENYKEHERPVLFIEELSTALKNIDFSGHPLSNIKEITARAELNTVTASLRVTYNSA